MISDTAPRALMPGEVIVWQGRQWRCTSLYLEAPERGLIIPAGELRQGLRAGDDVSVSWITKMAGAGWCDWPDFQTAFLAAAIFHGIQSRFVGKALQAAHEKRR